jgi:hypothetical protein
MCPSEVDPYFKLFLNTYDLMDKRKRIFNMSPASAHDKSEIFLSWIKDHFIPRKEPGPALLILDGHASHCSDVDI